MSTKTKKLGNQPWVNEFLMPLGVCQSVIEAANKYKDPQSAWLGGKDPAGLFKLLFLAGTDRQKILACLAEIVERVIPIYEKQFPGDTRISEAVNAVRMCAQDNSEKNKKAAARAAARIRGNSTDYAKSSAYAAMAAADACVATVPGACVIAVSAALAAAEDREAEREKQLECIWKHFPVTPFKKEKINE